MNEKKKFTVLLDNCQKRLARLKESNNKTSINNLLKSIGYLYKEKGDLDQALIYYQRSLTLSEEINDRQAKIESLKLISHIYSLRGDLDRALIYYQRSLTLSEKIGRKIDIALIIKEIGNICMKKADLDQAMSHYRQSLAYFKEIEYKQGIAELHNSISQIYIQKNDLDQALAHLSQSLSQSEEIGDNLIISHSLFKLVSVANDKNDPDQANKYLQNLRAINEKERSRIIGQRYRLAEALLLKTHSRMAQKSEALEIFQEIVNEEIVDYNLTAFAMLNLCELLLDELKFYGEKEVLKQVKELLTKIHDVALQQRSPQLEVQSLMLRAEFSLVDGDINRAFYLLELALLEAEDTGMKNWISRISREQEKLKKEQDKWVELNKRNAPLEDWIEQSGLKEGISEAIHLEEETGSRLDPFTLIPKDKFRV